MELYDTLTKNKKEFKPLKDKKLGLFVCGPTVYDLSHIGHARTYVAFDMFVKYLRHTGYEVNYLQNITDIDDKIIKRAGENNEEPGELAKRYEEEYYKDMEALDITAVDKYERATDHIPEIISQVERLLEGEIAYEIEGDGIYFDISKFEGYGKLSGRTAEGAEDATSRIDESINKKNKGDFALWKFSPPEADRETGEPKWKSPWGEGRPGWHIEDTAITEKHLGEQYDIHGGARDLIFPHHEAEIAQMEAISGREPLVNYWMHSGFLTINGEKMSKSLGNFVTIRDALENYSPQALRLFFITKHYRSPIDYTEKGLEEARANERKLEEFWMHIDKVKSKNAKGKTTNQNSKEIKEHIDNFWKNLEDDFNTPKAFAELFRLINTVYKTEALPDKDHSALVEFLKKVNEIFNIVNVEKLASSVSIPPDIIKLADEREKAREEKDWDRADELREEIENEGYEIKDTDEGPQVKKRG